MPVPYGNVPQGYAQFGFYSPYAPSSPSQQPIMMVPPGYPSSPMYPPPHVQQHPQAHHPQQQQQQQQQPHTQQQQQPMMPLSEGQLLHEGNIGHGGPGHSSGDADGGKPPM
ncbi:hypothetical protein BCR43DRAFT_485262 [Syncephalastrum racemosum]|uniref:Uncharacterized protein n=1 Tax=Syncephalastrum racemosum TaxID=13706 RepID=A0A1X2HM55_SYNRA|nr:hypothetical protein BCR43DRAFT_485262 [Syncephalastrum racemosum]